MTSNFIKMFLMQTINTAFVILLVNTKVKVVKEDIPRFPILTGLYDDFDPGWFYTVGSVLVSIKFFKF